MVNASDITVAIIDTSIDNTHPDIVGSIIDNKYIVNCEDSKHGTAVAGIISAYPSNDDGVLGIAPKTKIIAVVVTEDSKSITVENMISGINYAIDQGVDIINISSGFYNYDEKLYETIKKAYDAGIIIVASAGNGSNGSVMYPAKFSEVIAVASYNKNHEKMGLYDSDVVYLPGDNIVTTFPEIDSSDMYSSVSGTSFSTPIMSGIIALLKGTNKEIGNKEVYEYISKYYGQIISKEDIQDIINLL